MSMYYLRKGDVSSGPFAIGRLRQMWTAGEIVAGDWLCEHGSEEWVPAECIAEPTLEEAREMCAPRAAVRQARVSTARALLAVLMILCGGLLALAGLGFWPLLFVGPGLIAGAALVLCAGYVCGACGNRVEKGSRLCPHCRAGLVPMKG